MDFGTKISPGTATETLLLGVRIGAVVVAATLAARADAQTVGVTVGANQSVTNSSNLTPNVGIEFTGDGGTFTNDAGATIDATTKIFSGSGIPNSYNESFSNITINNYGTLEYQTNNGSGGFFGGNPVITGGTQTGQTTVSGITVNNYSTGVIAGLDSACCHDDVPLSFEGGVNGATVNNQGTISTAGTSSPDGAIRIGTGPYSTSNVLINNELGGMIKNTGEGQAILLTPGQYGTVSNVTIDNAGTIQGGGAVPGYIEGAISISGISNGASQVNITGVQINNLGTGTIDGTATGIAIDNSANTAPATISNSGTIKGNILFGSGGDSLQVTGGSVQGNIIGQNAGDTVSIATGSGSASITGAISNVSTVSVTSGTANLAQGPTGFSQFTIQNANTTATLSAAFTQTDGTTLVQGGATLNATQGIALSGGTLGGNGTINGNITQTGGTLQVGASPDALAITGNLNQTGGTITFEIDPSGAGFVTSTLVLTKGATVSITDVTITFDFLNGANPLAFFNSGDFNVDTFFKVANGDVFGNDFSLPTVFVDDTFDVNTPGYSLTNFDPDTGAITLAQNVPEPASGLLLLSGLGLLGLLRGRCRLRSLR